MLPYLQGENAMTAKYAKLILSGFFLIALFSLCPQTASAISKIDAGPAYVHIDVLQSGKTRNQIDMCAFKADANWCFCKGLCLKPGILVGSTKKSDLFVGGLGLGCCVPVYERTYITPSIGCTYTYLKAPIHLRVPVFGFDLHVHEKEISKSYSPYIAVDFSYGFTCSFRIGGSVQYAWSRSRTTIGDFVRNAKGRSKGAAYTFLIEQDINEKCSIDLAFAYNSTLTHEKHGLRGYGAKLAFAYWF